MHTNAAPSRPHIWRRNLETVPPEIYTSNDLSDMNRNDWRLERSSTLNTAFKEALHAGVEIISDALEMFRKLKRDESAILSQQAFYLQAMSDCIVNDINSYTLTMRDARRHIC